MARIIMPDGIRFLNAARAAGCLVIPDVRGAVKVQRWHLFTTWAVRVEADGTLINCDHRERTVMTLEEAAAMLEVPL